MVDLTAVNDAILAVLVPIGAIGIAVLLLVVALRAWRWWQVMIG